MDFISYRMRKGGLQRTSAIWHNLGKDVQSTLCTKVRAKRLHRLLHNISNYPPKKNTTSHHQLARFARLECAYSNIS